MREPTEFTIDAFKLRARPLPANQQLSILTTVSPLLAAGIAEIAPVYMQFKQDGIKSLSEVPMARMLSLITPVARELSKMPKGEMWGVIGECLGCVDLFKAGAWTPIWNDVAERPQFNEFDDNLFLVLRIAFSVFEASFTGFFPGSPSSSTSAPKA